VTQKDDRCVYVGTRLGLFVQPMSGRIGNLSYEIKKARVKKALDITPPRILDTRQASGLILTYIWSKKSRIPGLG
jgi:hypothetical protein